MGYVKTALKCRICETEEKGKIRKVKDYSKMYWKKRIFVRFKPKNPKRINYLKGLTFGPEKNSGYWVRGGIVTIFIKKAFKLDCLRIRN